MSNVHSLEAVGRGIARHSFERVKMYSKEFSSLRVMAKIINTRKLDI